MRLQYPNPHPPHSQCIITFLLPFPSILFPRGFGLKQEHSGDHLFPELFLSPAGLPLYQSFLMYSLWLQSVSVCAISSHTNSQTDTPPLLVFALVAPPSLSSLGKGGCRSHLVTHPLSWFINVTVEMLQLAAFPIAHHTYSALSLFKPLKWNMLLARTPFSPLRVCLCCRWEAESSSRSADLWDGQKPPDRSVNEHTHTHAKSQACADQYNGRSDGAHWGEGVRDCVRR